MASESTYENSAVRFADNVNAKVESKTFRKKLTFWRITSAIVLMICLVLSVTALTISLLPLKRKQVSMETKYALVTETDATTKEYLNTTQATTTAIAVTVKACANSYIYNPYARSCVRLVNLSKTWQDAKTSCENSGEHLATFESLESSFWFINLRKTKPGWNLASVWVGGKKGSDGVWRWVGKSTKPVALAPWGPDEPNNYDGNQECMASVVRGDYKFDDLACHLKYSFACEE